MGCLFHIPPEKSGTSEVPLKTTVLYSYLQKLFISYGTTIEKKFNLIIEAKHRNSDYILYKVYVLTRQL